MTTPIEWWARGEEGSVHIAESTGAYAGSGWGLSALFRRADRAPESSTMRMRAADVGGPTEIVP